MMIIPSHSASSPHEQSQSFPLKWGGRSLLTTLFWHIDILTCILKKQSNNVSQYYMTCRVKMGYKCINKMMRIIIPMNFKKIIIDNTHFTLSTLIDQVIWSCLDSLTYNVMGIITFWKVGTYQKAHQNSWERRTCRKEEEKWPSVQADMNLSSL